MRPTTSCILFLWFPPNKLEDLRLALRQVESYCVDKTNDKTHKPSNKTVAVQMGLNAIKLMSKNKTSFMCN